jgi:hypothetical protein
MRFFDFGERAEGFIAIGQEAVGVIAIGQLALGVVAIGQLARGVFVVGQLAVGVVAIGQLGVGVFGAAGMMAVAGRIARGIGIALFPKVKDDPDLPATTTLAALRDAGVGWLRVVFRRADTGEDTGEVRIEHEGEALDAEVAPKRAELAASVARSSWPHAVARFVVERRHVDDPQRDYRAPTSTKDVLVLDELRAIPVPKVRTSAFWISVALRSVALAILCAIWLFVAGAPLFNLFAPEPYALPGLESL